jgi:hypothetical protein
MDELAKQVKNDMLRTLLWAILSMGLACAVFYIAW